jgi:PAS domain S-box-containing protein/putative nucleotidyltransferase with HDIG domain
VITLNSDGLIEFINEEGCSILGYICEELQGKDFFKVLLPGEHSQREKEYFLKILHKTKSPKYDYREIPVLLKTGEKKKISWYFSLLSDDTCEKFKILCIGQDMSGYFESQKERDHSIFDLNQRVKELNCLYAISKVIEEPHIKIGEFFQKTVELIPGSFKEPEETYIRLSINNKKYTTSNFVETENKISQDIFVQGRKEGIIEVFCCKGKNNKDRDSFMEEESKLLYDIAQLLGLILEKYYIEEALHISEERLDYAVKGSGHGIWDWQPQTNEMYLSKRWKEILDYKNNEIENNIDEWLKRIHPDDKNRVMSKFEAQLKGKTQIFEVENRLKTKKGNYKWVLTKGEVVKRDEKNQPVRFAGTITDITGRKKLERRLKEKSRSFKMLSEINQLIIRIKSSKKLLEKTCDILTKTGDYKMAWIGYKDVHKEVLNPVSSSGIRKENLKKLNIELNDDNLAIDPTVKAFIEGHSVVSEDVANAPLFESFDKETLKKEYTSSVSLPLKCKNETFATLNIYSDELNIFDSEELSLLEELADNLSFGLNALKIRRELDKAREKLKRLNRLLYAVRSINQLIVKENNEKVLIKKVCWLLTKIQRYKTVFIMVLDNKNNISSWHYSGQNKELKPLINYFKKGEISCLNEVIDKKKHFAINDRSICESCSMLKECKKHNVVVYPLLSKERIQGLMLISTSKISKFIQEEKDLLEEISGDLGYALNKIEIERKKENYKKRLEEAEKRFQLFMNYLPAAAFIVNEEGTFYFVNKYYKKLLGVGEQLIGKNVRHILPEEVCEELIATNKDALSKGIVEIDERVPDKNGKVRYFRTLKFNLKNKKKPPLIGGLATDITELKNAEKIERESHNQLAKAFNTMIQTFSKFVEMKDPYTAGHQRKVSELATKIAEKMKLNPANIEAIKTAALLHDIGKIYVPSEILNKPGELTKLEFEIIKNHPVNGYELLKDIEFELPLAHYIRQHHERLDGSGYPDGLKNGEITLEAQILAIADVVEAMTSHRPYRPALGFNDAFDEIRNNAGKLYNEEAVKVCLELFEEGFAFSD